MTLKSCIPIIPSADLEKSLRFCVDGLGFTMDQDMRHGDKLVGCMSHNEHIYFWLIRRAGEPIPKEYDGIRLYWAPENLNEVRERLMQLGYAVSEIEDQNYGQTEFFVTDDDGYSHCFGLATKSE